VLTHTNTSTLNTPARCRQKQDAVWSWVFAFTLLAVLAGGALAFAGMAHHIMPVTWSNAIWTLVSRVKWHPMTW
jgi:hypothetical protein